MTYCIYCHSGETIHRGGKRRECKECNRYFNDPGSPKVTVFDIETLPLWFLGWGTGKQYISTHQIVRDYAILSWSAKSLFSSEVSADILTPQEAIDYNDERILEKIWKILDETDVVIYQNGDKFDRRRLNTRFAYWGFPPPRPYHSIDTLTASRKVFDLTSHSLDYAAMYFGIGKKIHTGMELWIRCAFGEPAALDKMAEYNLHDIWLLEDYYAKIRAWIPNHPNFSVWTSNYVDIEAGEQHCPVCRFVINLDAQLPDTYRTPIGYVYSSYRCPHCGATGRKNERTGKQRVAIRPNR